MLRRCYGVSLRGVHHDNTASGCSTRVDVIDSGSGSADHAQSICRIQNSVRNFCGAANNQSVILIYYLCELFWLEAASLVHFKSVLAKQIGSCRGNIVTNKDFHSSSIFTESISTGPIRILHYLSRCLHMPTCEDR